jgi:hypothetical protein
MAEPQPALALPSPTTDTLGLGNGRMVHGRADNHLPCTVVCPCTNNWAMRWNCLRCKQCTRRCQRRAVKPPYRALPCSIKPTMCNTCN